MMSYHRAIFFVLLSTAGFAVQDTVVKLLTQVGSIWQLMLLRSLVVILLLCFWAQLKDRWRDIIPISLGWPLVRALFMCLAYTLFYSSYPFVSLSDAAACFFMAPMFICVFACLFLKEKIGIWRISSVIVGFAGALLIIQPGSTEFRPVLIMPVIAGACYAAGVVVTRGFCSAHPSLSLTAVHNLFYAGLGLVIVSFLPIFPINPELVVQNPFLFTEWTPLASNVVIMIMANAAIHIIAMTASIRAYQMADATLVAPIEYSYLVFAVAIDFVIWALLPSGTTLIGMFLIIGSGLLITFREWTARQARINLPPK
jgi:drug/metabolite transporter (DMT)-like permease